MMQEEIRIAVEVLKKGGVILYPTDTIWGLGCDATSRKAVSRLHGIKKRADRKSYIILLDQQERIPEYVHQVPVKAWELLEQITTPLTIVYPGARNLARNVINEDGSVGIRIPRDPFVISLLGAFGKPLVSTSANFSGDTPPLSYRDISPDLIASVDHVVDYYRDRVESTKPSTIIRLLDNGDYEVIRK
ncbi:MAG TPA: L-threonylcarbamoyladenylate synthase [Bacteroidales bacterium]|nr:L-threonylcarbamoyladenylate synthase [Bacteroidales bacterium]